MSLSQYITWIRPEELSASDTKWLTACSKIGYYGYKPGDIVLMALKGEVQLWRVKDGAGIVITRILSHPAGKELDIWLLAGRGLIRLADGICEQLENYARSMGCRWVSGHSARPGLTRLYERLIGPSDMKSFTKEI